MTYVADTRENLIAISLARCASSVKRAGNAQWEFALTNGKPLGVSARLIEDWLVLDAALPDRIERGGWFDLLRLNASLQGLGKFVLIPDGRPTNFSLSHAAATAADCKLRKTEVCRASRYVHLRADIPLPADEESESDYQDALSGGLMTRLQETCAGLKSAFQSVREEKTANHTVPPSPVDLEGKVDSRVEELRRLCRATGWPFIERSAGKLMVDLDVRSAFYQAAFEQSAEGAHVSVEVAHFENLGDASCQALGLLLLAMGARVKLARPSIMQNGNQVIARFEVRFATMPAVVELTHAFSSLSVACALSGREAHAIQDEVIARNYLATTGAQASLPASSGA